MKEKLTGKQRYRVHRTFLGREFIVLQVEVAGYYTTNIGGCIDTEEYTEYRDATLEDLSMGPI